MRSAAHELERIAALAAGGEVMPPESAAEWRAMFALAREHGLLPLVRAGLKKRGLATSVPADALAEADAAAFGAAAMTARLVDTGRRLMSAARARGLTLVPVKGLDLIPDVYSEEERPMNDVDFLIDEERAEDVRALMLEEGGVFEGGGLDEKFMRRFGGEYKFVFRGAVPILVETQWDIAAAPYFKRGFTFDSRELLRRVGADGRLDRASALVYIVFHQCAAHSFSRLGWLLDVHRLVERGNPDWESASRLVSDFGMKRMFHAAARLCGRFFGTEFPAEFMAGLGSLPPRLERAAMDCLEGRGAVAGTGALPLLLCGNPARAAAGFLFPGTEFIALRHCLPRYTAAAYGLVRPVSLAAAAAARMLRQSRA